MHVYVYRVTLTIITPAPIKAHELRSKSKTELLRQLDDFQQELAQVFIEFLY